MVQQRFALLWGLGAYGAYKCKIAKKMRVIQQRFALLWDPGACGVYKYKNTNEIPILRSPVVLPDMRAGKCPLDDDPGLRTTKV